MHTHALGTSSGEPYMSDLTFAYLEDSGHFVAARNYINGDRYTANNNAYLDNYTYAKGGRFLEATGAGISVGGLSKIAEFFGWTYSRESRESYLRTPGQLRWGAKKGCDFFQKKASISWPDSYVCKTNANAGCTADNRMSARCSVKEWSSVESRYSCLSSGNCPNVNSESPNLPSEYRHIDGSATAGGYNNAMDYVRLLLFLSLSLSLVFHTHTHTHTHSSRFARLTHGTRHIPQVPVRVGYWSCLDKKPLTASSQGVAGNQSVDFSGLFNSLSADLENFGGQQYGTEARCFESTLREFGSVLSLTFDTYGLCYAANCYTADYLQIGIRGRDGGTEWYHCPSGKTLYLAGFSGSVQCPNTIEFCDHEDITGVFMTETQIWAAWYVHVHSIIRTLVHSKYIHTYTQGHHRCDCRNSIDHHHHHLLLS